ncbi:hypothetical protein V6N13_059673 [Hibiscus sabdariffa]
MIGLWAYSNILVYGGEEELRIKGYTDASFQTDKDDSRSQSGVIPSISVAVDLYCDNNGAIAQAKEPRSHQRSKHILRPFHLIREIINRGDVEICKVHTDDNIAHPLTKPLAQQKHDRHTESLGIRYIKHSKVAAQPSPLDLRRLLLSRERDCAIFFAFGKEFPKFCSLVYSGGLSRDLDEIFVEIQDPKSKNKKSRRRGKHMDMLDVGCLMLATMTPELQKQHEDMVAYEMIQNLNEIYEGQAHQERYETSKALFQCKMSEGSPVGAHVIKMMGYIQTLEKLGFALNDELAVDVVLQSLPDSFNQFVLNFNMNEINKTLPQLLGMLRTAEGNMKKGGSKSILMVREAKGKGKKVAKSKGTGKTKPKGKEALKPKGGVSKDGKCFHCGTAHEKESR